MGILKHFADNDSSASLAQKYRRSRFKLFSDLVDSIDGPVKILDVGGTEAFWASMGWAYRDDVHITVGNVFEDQTTAKNIQHVLLDGRKMPFYEDGTFDIVFSNSVIEHMSSWEDQEDMANEIARVGKRYFVQTPNYYFPIEPHFLVPGFQFLPESTRISLVRNFNLGWAEKTDDEEVARTIVQEVRLLKLSELEKLFPGSSVFRERFLGLSKSFIVYKGWNL